MTTQLFDELIHRGLMTEDEAVQFDQSWENANHLLNGGDEVTDKEKEEILLDYQAMFSVLEDTENKLVELSEDHEELKNIVNKSIGGSK